MLGSKPIRNELVHWERDDNGEVLITLTRQTGWKINLLAKIFYVPKERKIGLDEIGSQVWEMCDGKHTVDRMIRRLAQTHQLNRREAEVALTTYLRQLGKKRLVGFAVSKKRKA
ncbi:MAG: PqqD family protein [Candidatus Latescibacteria bacterium]|nr:PqqD family protein [Candidatus Latescibacterota bacterium]